MEASSNLSAAYKSRTNAPFTIVEAFPAASDGVEGRTKHLNDLRKAISSVQEQVNKALTLCMEEDKANDAAAKTSSPAVDDAAEEENYGEEVQGDDQS